MVGRGTDPEVVADIGNLMGERFEDPDLAPIRPPDDHPIYEHLKQTRTYEIAVGMQGLETPPGMYKIQWKQVDPPWYVPKKAWAGALAGTVVSKSPGSVARLKRVLVDEAGRLERALAVEQEATVAAFATADARAAVARFHERSSR